MYLPLSTAKEIELDFDNEILYSICTLVTIKEEYQEMMSSFVEAGFDTSFCEFLYIDNTTHNKSEAYQGLNYFLQKAKGETTLDFGDEYVDQYRDVYISNDSKNG